MQRERQPGNAAPADTVSSRTRDRRAAIVAGAVSVFKEKGYGAARMDEIAEAAGVTKPTLYSYFKNKEEVFKEAALVGAQLCLPMIRAHAANSALSAWEKVEQSLDAAYVGMFDNNAGDMCAVIAETATAFPAIARHFRDEFVLEMKELLVQIVREGVASGEFRPSPLDHGSEFFVGPVLLHALHRSMFSQLDDEPPIDLAAAKAAHLEVLRRVLIG